MDSVSRDIFGADHVRVFTPDEEARKRVMYESMRPRRKHFIDRIGYDRWDPFQSPKDPLDIRQDATRRTTQELVRDFLQTRDRSSPGNDYARGVLECALGLVNKEEKFRGVYEFCLWYSGQLTALNDE